MSAPWRPPATPQAQPRPYFLINQLQLAMVTRLEKPLKEIGLSPAVARVLNAIAVRPRLSSSALARMLGMKPQSITQSMLVLEGEGLVERRPSDQDHRAMQVHITPKGWAARERHMAMIQEMYREIFHDLSGREIDTLVELLTKAVTTARPQAMDYFSSYVNPTDKPPQDTMAE
jgi:DNA-binding MarR family transcriptional regulator